jgi:surfeit locus 1 family protein
MRRYAIFLIAIPAALVCIRLGLWQLSRLHERRAKNQSLRAAMQLPPVDAREAPDRAPPFRRLKAQGRFDYARQILVEVAMEGVPALIIVTPLRMSDGSAVLVERGWSSSLDTSTVWLRQLNEGDSASATGVVVDAGPDLPVRPDTAWPRPRFVQRPTPRTLAAVYPYRLRPFLLRRTDQLPAGSRLRPVPVPELTEGPHLSYVVQWWSFAVIILVGSVFLYRREEGRGKRED